MNTKSDEWRGRTLICLALFALLLTGCREISLPLGDSDDELLTKQAGINHVMRNYNAATIKEDFSRMYDSLSANDKESITRAEYIKRQEYLSGIRPSSEEISQIDIKKMDVGDSTATVEVELLTKFHALKRERTLVFADGKWWMTLSKEAKEALLIGKSFEEFKGQYATSTTAGGE